MSPTLQDQIDCVKREIGLRERVYPGFIARRRLSQDQADREPARMRAVLQTLQLLQQQCTITD